ncbi:hypothetical protein SeMB42_g07797, partial [Synchytrium endobioticum]
FMACAIMSKYLIIVLLLLKLFHYVFADPEVPDAILKQRSEAIRREGWMHQYTRMHRQRRKDLESAINRRLTKDPELDENVLMSFVVQYIMHPVDVGFTKDHVTLPKAEMSQAEIEFRWEALKLANIFVPACYQGLKEKYRDEMKKRVADAMFGSAPTIEYPEDQINWPSAVMLMVFEVHRGAKALESLKASNESPVSSFTEADALLGCATNSWPWDDSYEVEFAPDLYSRSEFEHGLEPLVYRIHYLKVRIQRSQFIVEACSKFLQQRLNNRSIQEQIVMVQEQAGSLSDQEKKQIELDRKQEEGLIKCIRRGIETEKRQTKEIEEIRQCIRNLYDCLVNMPNNVEAGIQHEEIDKLKAEVSANDYEGEEAIAKLQDILVDNPLEFLLGNTGVPSKVISLFGLVTPLGSYIPQLQASPYLGLAAEYHLLLLWRCMQRLSLLKRFKNYYDVEPPYGLEVERVNEAEEKIMIFARHVLEMFDFYENTAGGMAAQPRIPRMSEEERNIARKLLHPDDTQDVMDLDNTVEAASSHTGYTGAQEDIYNPGTTYRGADGESELGMPSRADLEEAFV